MKQSEAKKLFIKYTNTQFEQWGFKEKKNRRSEAIYIRNKKNGFERIGVSTTNYYPEVVFGMGTSKRINIIEEILYQINEKYALGLNLTKDETWTLSFQGNRLNKRRLELLEVENKDNEQGVKDSTEILMNFIENELLPSYDLFDDLRELDKRINGKGENFWEDDIGTSKPFNLGGKFFYRRFIIARLSKSDKDFNLFFEFWLDFVNKRSIEKSGKIALDKNDLEHYVMKFILYLQEHVSPIY